MFVCWSFSSVVRLFWFCDFYDLLGWLGCFTLTFVCVNVVFVFVGCLGVAICLVGIGCSCLRRCCFCLFCSVLSLGVCFMFCL